MATCPRAAICSIGVSVVDSVAMAICDSFYLPVEWRNTQHYRVKSESTRAFWEEQRTESPAAYAEIFKKDLAREKLSNALQKLVKFLKGYTGESGDQLSLVGNGSEFDNAIILDACEQCGVDLELPHYRHDSLRTFIACARRATKTDVKAGLDFLGDKHHALDDAFFESMILIRCLMVMESSSDLLLTEKEC